METPTMPPTEPTQPAKQPWYRRRGFLVGGAICVVVAATVLVDLPTNTSRPQAISDENTVISSINTDLYPCQFAVKESFSLYAGETHNSLTPSDRSDVPGMLGDDLAACTFTDNSIYDLSNIEVPGSADGRDIGEMVVTVTDWATSDAVGAISQIETLAGDPTNKGALKSLAGYERALTSDRTKAFSELDAADKVLDAHLAPPDLPVVPTPAR
jgi:hypothetical protein